MNSGTVLAGTDGFTSMTNGKRSMLATGAMLRMKLKLRLSYNAALADPKLKARLADLGSTVAGGSAADYGRRLEEEAEKWGKVIRAADIKPQG